MQKAYSRWWEGGTLLQQLRGEWFNAVSNLMAFCSNQPEKKHSVLKFQHQTVRLFSLLYGSALRQVSTMSDNELEFIDIEGFEAESIVHLQSCHDSCELVLQWIQRLIVDVNTAGVINIAPPILSRVYNQLGNGIVNLNNARKIKDFPIPFPLAQMVTFMLLAHTVTTIVVAALSLSSPYMAFLATFTVSASFWGVNYMAVELENPYGNDANDLPLHEMQRDMNQSLCSLLHPTAQNVPAYAYHPVRDEALLVEKIDMAEYLRQLKRKMQDAALETSGDQIDDKDRPVIDYCTDGHAQSGLATHGDAIDRSYRDGMLDTRKKEEAAAAEDTTLNKTTHPSLDEPRAKKPPVRQPEETHLAAPPGTEVFYDIEAPEPREEGSTAITAHLIKRDLRTSQDARMPMKVNDICLRQNLLIQEEVRADIGRLSAEATSAAWTPALLKKRPSLDENTWLASDFSSDEICSKSSSMGGFFKSISHRSEAFDAREHDPRALDLKGAAGTKFTHAAAPHRTHHVRPPRAMTGTMLCVDKPQEERAGIGWSSRCS